MRLICHDRDASWLSRVMPVNCHDRDATWHRHKITIFSLSQYQIFPTMHNKLTSNFSFQLYSLPKRPYTAKYDTQIYLAFTNLLTQNSIIPFTIQQYTFLPLPNKQNLIISLRFQSNIQSLYIDIQPYAWRTSAYEDISGGTSHQWLHQVVNTSVKTL